ILPGIGSEALDMVDTHARPGDFDLDGQPVDLATRLRPQSFLLDRVLRGAQTPLGMVSPALRDGRRWLLTRPAPDIRSDVIGSAGTTDRYFGQGEIVYRGSSGDGGIGFNGALQYDVFDNPGPVAIANEPIDHNNLEAIATRAALRLDDVVIPGSVRASFYAFGNGRNYYLHPFALDLAHAPEEDRAFVQAAASYDLDLGVTRLSVDGAYTRDYVETGDGEAWDDFSRYLRDPSEPEASTDGLTWRGDDPTKPGDQGHLYDYYLRSLNQQTRFRIDTHTTWSAAHGTRHFAPLRLGAELNSTRWRLFEHLAPSQTAVGGDGAFQLTRNFGYSRDGQTRDPRPGHDPRKPSQVAVFASQRATLGLAQIDGGFRWESFSSGQRPLLDRGNPLGADETLTEADLGSEVTTSGLDPRLGLYLPLGRRTDLWIDSGRTREIPPLEALYFDPDLLTIQAGTAQEDRLGREFIFGSPDLAPALRSAFQVGVRHELSPKTTLRFSAGLARTSDTWVARAHDVGSDRVSYYENGGHRREATAHASMRVRTGTRSTLRVSYDLSRLETDVIEPAPLYWTLEHPGEPLQNVARPESPLGYSIWLDDGVDRGYFPSMLDRRHRLSAAWLLPLALDALGFETGEIGRLAITMRAASGLPYTPTFVRAEGNVADALEPAKLTAGDLNRARAPWIWQIDAAATHGFDLLGRDAEMRFEVRNLANHHNVRRVYTATGEADQDGWLDTPAGQAAIQQNGEGFRAAYLNAIDDPTNYDDGITGRIALRVRF
ncbi:MAG: hypothetical protein KC729_05190, partial [Candidatus Eisenbacteria bacterium]|nr:hypothetical protein [Candidatus Eisenbacteria bacterium]